MKKIALYILAAAAVIVGCSKNNVENTVPTVNGEDAWMYDATLPVPIRFGLEAGSLTKAAPIDVVSDMVGKKFGFYAVNSGRDPLSGSWSRDTDLEMPQGAEATCVPWSDGKYGFEFTDGPYYYGQTDWTPYTFYGYYAHINDVESPSYDDKQEELMKGGYIAVKLGIGHTDILWGKAEASPESVQTSSGDTCYGFNAPYLRNGGKQPVMRFKHVTAGVSFSAELIKSQQTNVSTPDIQIDSVKILNAPVLANLFIAYGSNLQKEGTFTAKESGTISLAGLPTSLTDESPIPLGNESLFLCPAKSYEMEVKYTVGSTQKMSYKVSLAPETILKDENNKPILDEDGQKQVEQGFVAGYIYRYNLKIYSPEEIAIEAEVEPYKSAFDGNEGDGFTEDEDGNLWADIIPDKHI